MSLADDPRDGPGMIELPTTASVGAAVMNSRLETEVGQLLAGAYPGHLWHIEADVHGGSCRIINLSLSTGPGARPWGFVLHLAKIATASELRRKVLLAGGEVLERYKQRRGAKDDDAIDDLPHDFRGMPIGDYS